MTEQRHYTVTEANAKLGWIAEQLERVRDARRALVDDEARAALAEAHPGNGGGKPGRVVSEAFVELNAVLSGLHELGIVVRDLERGLVDFPAVRDGREIYLCWEEGEPEVAFWHYPEAGYGGRQPL